MGDYNGIGPEVVLKSLSKPLPENVTPVIMGHPDIFSYYASTLDRSPDLSVINSLNNTLPGKVNLIRCCNDEDIELAPGSTTRKAGLASMEAVEAGIDACLSGEADALVTSPISKEAIHLAGYRVPGHTEFLAMKSETDDVTMILASGNLRVGLVTGHIPVRRIPEELTADLLLSKLRTLNESLTRDFGIPEPKIAVFGLNPHAGDGGVLGNEEIEIITPAIAQAVKGGIKADGPLPADGFFGSRMQDQFDGILAMYHDQGLVPFKALSFGSGVNFTAGLPFIRTSPDHGTAFGIAGKNRADERSFLEAFRLAVTMVKNRKKAADDYAG
jgi:4-hydroxythreonine-4-phosphate dehydrogenase